MITYFERESMILRRVFVPKGDKCGVNFTMKSFVASVVHIVQTERIKPKRLIH